MPSSNAPCSVSRGRPKIPLYHSTFSLSKLRWIFMFFLPILMHLHSLRPLCHPCPFLQTVSSFGKLCLWHAARREQKLSQDSVHARRCLGSQTGNRHSQGMESARQKVQRCFWDRARCCCHYWCAFAGCVCCNENKDLKCQIWTSGGWRQTISFPFPTKNVIKLFGFSSYGGDAGGMIPPTVSLLVYTRE